MLNKSAEKVRLLIAGGQGYLNDSVRGAMNQAGYEIVGEMSCRNGIVEFVDANHPDIILVCLDEIGLAGIDFVHKVKQRHPSTVVVVTMRQDNDDWFFAALKGGANACIKWVDDPAEILDVIKQALRGEYPITKTIFRPAVASRILSEFSGETDGSRGSHSVAARLLPVEIGILSRISNGSLMREIADDMRISEDTIRQRLYTILGKLIASNWNSQFSDVKRVT